MTKTNVWKCVTLRSLNASLELDEEVAIILSEFDTQGVSEVTAANSLVTLEWKVYFLPEVFSDDICVRIREMIAQMQLPLELSVVEDIQRENWHDNWRQYFRPIDLTPTIRIVPEWEKGTSAADKLEIAILPGMAFGTGTHATTQLCMMTMETLLRSEDTLASRNLLDCGCGTAILAMLGVKLGVGCAVGFDIDPDFLENAEDNLKLNDVASDLVQLIVGGLDAIDPQPYSYIICNMLSREFKPLIPAFHLYSSDDTILVLSGLLATESEEIQELVSKAGFTTIETSQLDEWGCIVARRTYGG